MNSFPIKTDEQGRTETKYVDDLTDADLNRLNDLLPWQCFTLDAKGRRFGKQASADKRNLPQQIPDRRIVDLNQRMPLQGMSVLEVGCFEGIHTIALAGYGAKVTAIDSRIENVAKTIVRIWSFGLDATVLKCDVEQGEDFDKVPEVDITHHVGVLYHLVDPITHLNKVLARTRRAILVDTHYAAVEETSRTYQAAGETYAYKYFSEGGREAAFAGMYDHAKWLSLDTLVSVFKKNNFHNVDVLELRDERNGPRVLLFASRP